MWAIGNWLRGGLIDGVEDVDGVDTVGPSRCLTRSLGIHGWSRLDPVLLAALVLESPVLLVGPHGTAKTLIVERLAGALGLELRHYNASLVNYDDLVGIPLPDDDGGLRFVGTAAAIWDAEFAFFDELTRCRPDLQNKLFPIVHERRVAGVRLERLLHRWAAMNPAAPDDVESAIGDVYHGAEPLDPALADRFQFVVTVPTWAELMPEDRRRVVSGDDRVDAEAVRRLIAECRSKIESVRRAEREAVVRWAVAIVDHLHHANVVLSPRRARMLVDGALAVHAARTVLDGGLAGGDIEASAEVALRNGLPQTAGEVPPSPAVVVAAHRQAWGLAMLADDDPRRTILEEPDRLRRVKLGVDLGVDEPELAQLVTQALEAEAGESGRIAVATAMFLALRSGHTLRPSVWGTLSTLSSRCLTPREEKVRVAPGPLMEAWREISSYTTDHYETHDYSGRSARRSRIERGYLLGHFPMLWATESWRSGLKRLDAALDLFGVAM